MSSFTCPNCFKNNFERHGYYKRYIIVNDIKKDFNAMMKKLRICQKYK